MKRIQENKIAGIGPRAVAASRFFIALVGAGLAVAALAAEPGEIGKEAAAPRTRPDLSGHWQLNAKASDDPMQKAKEALPSPAQAGGGRRGMGGGMGGGRQGQRPGGGMGNMPSPAELSAMLTVAQALRITHQEPLLLIEDENGQRQRLYTDFRGASVSASGGLNQRVAVAGWEGAALVVETTMIGKQYIQSYQIAPEGRLIVTTQARLSEGKPVSFRLVYDAEKPGPGGRPNADSSGGRQ